MSLNNNKSNSTIDLRSAVEKSANNKPSPSGSMQQKDFHSSTQSLHSNQGNNKPNNRRFQRRNSHNSNQSLSGNPSNNETPNKNVTDSPEQQSTSGENTRNFNRNKSQQRGNNRMPQRNNKFHSSTQSLNTDTNNQSQSSNGNVKNPFRQQAKPSEQPEDGIGDLPTINKSNRNRTQSNDRNSLSNQRSQSTSDLRNTSGSGNGKSNRNRSLQRNSFNGSTQSLNEGASTSGHQQRTSQQNSSNRRNSNDKRNFNNNTNNNNRNSSHGQGRFSKPRNANPDDNDDTILPKPQTFKLLLRHMPIDRSDREITNLCKGFGNVVNGLKIFRDRRNRCVYVILQSAAEADLTMRGINRSNMGIVVEIVADNVRGRQGNRNDGQKFNKLARNGPCLLCKIITTQKCKRCGSFYCSRKCQETDWPKHCLQCMQMPGLG